MDKELSDLFENKTEHTEEDTSDKKGEDNMTKTGTIASVLIAIVAFAAAFTVPGRGEARAESRRVPCS